MKITGKIYGLTRDIISGQNLLTIAYEGNLGDEINELTDKQISVDIKQYSEKRSLNANRYMWWLCNEIGDRIRMSKNDVYRMAVKEVGWYRDYHIVEKEVESFKTGWELIGTGWVTEIVDYEEYCVIVRAYFGSSTYSKKRMSRIIDWLSEEAKQLGITLMTDREKSLLIDKWEGVKICRTKSS